MGWIVLPDGYEIVPKDEYGKHKGDSSLLYWSPRAGEWRERAHPGNRLFDTDTYARPIRKRTLWVPASERQPPAGVRVATRVSGGAWCGTSTCVTSATLPDSIEWLDLDAAETIEAERDRLAAQYAEHAARIAELEAERDDWKRTAAYGDTPTARRLDEIASDVAEALGRIRGDGIKVNIVIKGSNQ